MIIERICVLAILFAPFFGATQSYHGFVDDNFNGVYGVVANPANVVDSRHRFNMNVVSFNGLLSSGFDTPKLNSADLFSENTGLFTTAFDSWLFNGPLQNTEEGEVPSTSLVNLDVLAPLSFMATINERYAFGLLLRGRAVYNFNNIDGRFWKGLANGFLVEEDFGFQNQSFDVATHYWSEVGLTYGAVVVPGGKHFLKVGGTFKLLFGLGAEQVYVDTSANNPVPFAANYIGGENEEQRQIELDGGLTYIRTFNPNTTDSDFSFFGNRPGRTPLRFGGDLGLVYEYRTWGSSRTGTARNDAGFNKYKLKLAVSVLDLGKVVYKDIPATGTNIINFSEASVFNAAALSNDFLGAIDALEAQGTGEVLVQRPGGDLEVALPTSVQVSVDYLIKDGLPFYINGSFNSTLVQSSLPFNNNRLNLYAATLRYERKRISLYLPLNSSKLSGTNLGFGARLGPVTLGTASINNLFESDGGLGQWYFGFNVPLLQDRDQTSRARGSHHKKRRKHHRWSNKRRKGGR